MESVQQHLSLHGYDLKKNIGQGGYGSVFLVHSHRYKSDFAAKVMKRKATLAASEEAEIRTLMRLDHPHIVKLYDYFEEGEYLYMILEFCQNGSLADLIKKHKFMPMGWIICNCYKIAEALKACHDMGIAHRDIKAENILIDAYGRPKIADFGLGIDCCVGESILSTAGSLAYSPPEFFRTRGHDPFKSDVWALGILFYFVCVGSLPWRGGNRHDIIKEISTASILLDERELGHNMKSLLSRMLDSDPASRPTMKEVVEKYVIRPQDQISFSSSQLPELQMRVEGYSSSRPVINCFAQRRDLQAVQRFRSRGILGAKVANIEMLRTFQKRNSIGIV